MKTIKYMIAAALISTALFTGCNKDNNMAGTAAYETISGQNAANINFRLYPLLPPAGALIKWDKGYISVSTIIFNGVQNNGEMLQQQQFGAEVGKAFDLLGSSN